MNLAERSAAFKKLGIYLGAIDAEEKIQLFQRARNENPWFTNESLDQSLESITEMLSGDNIQNWLGNYNLSDHPSKAVGVVLAGNIPLVGFHDILCVLITGNRVLIKPSSKDSVMVSFLMQKLIETEPAFSDKIEIVDRLRNFDAVIATGSDNSARYFEYYFKKYPSIIRKNRTSCAVLSGFESDPELKRLGRDVFSYFGLGCRNVSKLYLPEGFDFGRLFGSWKEYDGVMMHHKYHNNYEYQKSILLVNRIHFYDSGFILLKESEKVVSPIAVLYFQYYTDVESLTMMIEANSEKFQCVVGQIKPATVKTGRAQYPALSDYADDADTILFLTGLN